MDFFDRVGDTLVTAGKDVAQKAKDLSGTAKLNLDIRAKEDYIKKQYAEIGRMYYEAHQSDEDMEYKEQMDLIAEAMEEIARMREDLLKIKGARTCAKCGAVVDEKAAFCGKCGAKMDIFED